MSKGEKVDNWFDGWNPSGRDEIQEELSFFAPFPLLFFKYLHLVVGPIRP